MRYELDELLGIDRSNPTTRLAIAGTRSAGEVVDSLSQRRRDLGMSRADVAGLLGWSESGVAKVEINRDPRLSTLTRYALALDCWVEHSIRMDTPDEVLERRPLTNDETPPVTS